jgi:hypothetical protein
MARLKKNRIFKRKEIIAVLLRFGVIPPEGATTDKLFTMMEEEIKKPPPPPRP